jgi:hypothetical protein
MARSCRTRARADLDGGMPARSATGGECVAAPPTWPEGTAESAHRGRSEVHAERWRCIKYDLAAVSAAVGIAYRAKNSR